MFSSFLMLLLPPSNRNLWYSLLFSSSLQRLFSLPRSHLQCFPHFAGRLSIGARCCAPTLSWGCVGRGPAGKPVAERPNLRYFETQTPRSFRSTPFFLHGQLQWHCEVSGKLDDYFSADVFKEKPAVRHLMPLQDRASSEKMVSAMPRGVWLRFFFSRAISSQ